MYSLYNELLSVVVQGCKTGHPCDSRQRILHKSGSAYNNFTNNVSIT